MSRDPIDDAAAALRRGALVVFPTDTVYGLAARPDDPAATGRIFEAKARPRHLTIPVLVATTAEARRVATFDARAERLATAWPGALTLVLPRTEASRGWDLGAERGTVGVRVPAEPLALALLARTGPLAVTSANRSGEPPARTCDELRDVFGDAVDVHLCRAEPLEQTPSTVVDLTGAEPRIVRIGAVPADAVERLLTSEDPLLDSGPRR
jgi:tRNA threonylcarbamoyl adenosine modification protein (Sua5/YciO/YrdC/YwlC family)